MKKQRAVLALFDPNGMFDKITRTDDVGKNELIGTAYAAILAAQDDMAKDACPCANCTFMTSEILTLRRRFEEFFARARQTIPAKAGEETAASSEEPPHGTLH